MPTFTGTDAGEILTGTDGDDTFYSSRGQDVIIGGAGFDIAIIDYSTYLGTTAVGQTVSRDIYYDGLGATLRASDGLTSVEIHQVERIEVTMGSGGDVFYFDLNYIPSGWSVRIDAGAGFDVISIRSEFSTTPLVMGAGSNLDLINFEQFDLRLGSGNDQLTMGIGNDTVQAGAGDDIINGGSGNDSLQGGLGGDTLEGGDGDDLLYATDDYTGSDSGSERDIINGGAGNDLVSVGYSDDAEGGSGTDRLSLSLRGSTTGVTLDLSVLLTGGTLSFGGGTIHGFEQYATIYGSEYGDTITTGNMAYNGAQGFGGIFGFGGNDTITTGTSNDTAGGGSGDDVLRGGDGSDRLSGDEGVDQVYGENGNDTLWGGTGNDLLYGGDGNDSILGSEDNDSLWGDAGDDTLNGEAGNDHLYGGVGNDTLTGDFGADILEGGDGNDIYVVDANDSVIEQANGGTDEIRAGTETYSLADSPEIENLTGTFVAFGSMDQTLTGNDRDNRIDGGIGADRMIGGLGNDTYVVDNVLDSVVELTGGGTDTVISTASSFALIGSANFVENVTLGDIQGVGACGNALANTITGNLSDNWLQGGAGADVIIGNAGGDYLDGGEGDDTLNGGEGVDWLVGGVGNDTLTGGAWNDVFFFGSPLTANVDRITDFALGDTIYLDTLVFTNLAAGALATTAFRAGTSATAASHRIIYNSSTGQIFYDADGNGAGAAILFATVNAGTSLTAASFFIGTEGILAIQAEVSYLLASNERDLQLTGVAAIDGTGNELNNQISGNDAANWLDGGTGDDQLAGLGGNDILTGGVGTDLLTGSAGVDTFRDTRAGLNGDTITDFTLGETLVFTDATFGSFTFSLSGSTLTYSGGSLTLTGASGTLVASAAAGGGVQLTIQAAVIADVRNDFNGDGRSDVLWRNTNGQLSDWLGQANGGFVTNDANALTTVPTSWEVTGTGDFNGDGRDDILWRNTNGQLSNWLGTATGGFVTNDANAFTTVPTSWQVAGVGDFNGDGRDDILWRNTNGQLSDWLGTATGGFTPNDANALTSAPTSWQVAGVGDFNGDGRDDILWRNTNGQLSDWLGQATGGFVGNDANALTSAPTSWSVVGTGDFNGDGRDDILWRNTNGQLSDWLGQANGGFVSNDANAFTTVPTSWSVVAIGDYNGDGRDDILWRNTNGQLSNWLGTATGGFTPNDPNAFTTVPTSWTVQPDYLVN